MSNKTQELKKAMQAWWIKAERARYEYGTLGRVNADLTVTVDADRQDFVYVTLQTGTLIIAYNRGSGAVDKRAGLPVRVRDDVGKKIIDGINTSGFSTGDSNAPDSVYTVNNVAPDSHGNVTLDSDDITEGSTNLYTTATSVGAAINSASTDDTIADTDTFGYTTGSTLKKTAWSVIKSTLKTYFDTLYDKTATIIAALTGKTTPIDADGFVISDSAASGAPKLVTGTNLKAYMKTYWDTIYAPIAKGVTNGDSHDHNGGDGAQIPTGGIVDAAVTLAKMANIATDSLIGRDTALSGVPENITLNATLSMDGSGHLQRAALSGDVSASAGSNTTAIGSNKVLTAMIADAQVTLAKMADLAQSTIIGRAAGAGTGVPTALSVAQVVAIINSTLDHGGLAGLSDDDHAQYLLLAGRSGGQTVNGDTASGGNLTLNSTSHATKGKILFGASSAYDGANVRLGISTTSPAHPLQVGAAATDMHTSTDDVVLNNTEGGTVSLATAKTTAKRSGLVFIRSRGDFTTPTAPSADDQVGFVGWKIWDGSAAQLVGLLEGYVDGAVSSGTAPVRVSVLTSPTGGAGRTVRQTWFNDGKVAIGDLTAVGASLLGVKAGTSSNDAAVGGVLISDPAQHSSAAAGSGTLFTYSVPANTLNGVGQSLWIECHGSFANSAGIKVVNLKFDGTTVATTTASASSPGTFVFRARIFKSASNTTKGWGWGKGTGSASDSYTEYSDTPTLTASKDITVTFTAGGAAAGDVKLQSIIVGFDDTNS